MLRETARGEVALPTKPGTPDLAERPREGARYQVVGPVAKGGVGAVFRGRDTEVGREVAIKVLLERHGGNETMVRRFLEEARVEGRLEHPGVVPVHEIGFLADARPFFTMKLVKGETLAALLRARTDVAADRRRCLGIFEKVLETMAYAHAQGVIHRDLKPSNIMVGAFGEVQVMDWGLSKVLGAGAAEEAPGSGGPPGEPTAAGAAGVEGAEPRSETGSVMGTPSYMPPEQARGEVEKLDARSDVFSLGAILCEILTGEPPFTGDSPREIRERAAAAELRPALDRLGASRADRELTALVTHCLAAEPESRPSDAGEVASAFSAYLASLDERARKAEIAAAEARVKAAEERRARRLTLALAAAILIAILVALAAYLWLEAARGGRVARATGTVNRALEDVVSLRGAARAAPVEDVSAWDRVRAAVERAEAVLAQGDVEPAARERLASVALEVRDEGARFRAAAAQAAADRAMVQQLEDIRLRAAELWETSGDFEAPTDAAYAAAFRDHGIDVDALAPEEAARRIAASAISMSLVAALDDWVGVRHRQADRGKGKPDWARLHAIAQAADPDPVRRRAREAAHADDLAALRTLAGEADLETWPLATLDLLGGTLMAVGGPEEAVSLLSTARRRHPHDFWIHLNLGLWLERVKPPRCNEAARCLEAAVAVRPDSPVARTRLAGILQRLGELEAAECSCRDALRIAPAFAPAHHTLGLVLQQMGRHSEARAALDEAIRLGPDSLVSHAAIAELLRVTGDLPGALARVNSVIERAPERGDFRYLLGRILQDLGRPEEALAAYRKAIELDSHRAERWYTQGRLLQDEQKTGEALAAYRKAIELDPQYADAHVHLGLVLKQLGKIDEAVASCETALRIDPNHAVAHNNLGVVFSERGDVAGAHAAFRRALALDPRYVDAHNNLGGLLFRGGDFAGAAASFRRALAVEPENVKSLVYLGQTLSRQGRPRESLRCFEGALRLRPGDFDALTSLAVVWLEELGDPAKALAYAREAARAAPQSLAARSKLGAVLVRNGRLEEALAEFQAVAALDPRDVEAQVRLGHCHAMMKNLPAAAGTFRAAVELQPDSLDAQKGLGTVLKTLGDRAGALRAFEAAVKADPRDAEAQVSLAGVLAEQGELEQAISICRAALELEPDSIRAWYQLGAAYLNRGRPIESARALAEAARLCPENASMRRAHGIALAHCGRLEEAVSELETALKLAPTLPDVRKELERLRRLAALEPELPRILGGNDGDLAPAVRGDVARLCRYKGLTAASARFWRSAFAGDPKLLEDGDAVHDAACAAAVAGSGRGEDAAALSATDRGRWREQAVAWLRLELQAIQRRLGSAGDSGRGAIRDSLAHFKRDPDLEALRDERFTALLPDSESKACAALWRDVDELLAALEPPRPDVPR